MKPQTLKKYIEGSASQKEKEEVQLWIEKDEKNRQEFLSLRTLYDIILGNLSEKTSKSSQNKNAGRNSLIIFIQIAASILITFGFSYYLFSKNDPKENVIMQTLNIPAGQRAELILTDGTKVWLNALTTLTFPNKFDENSREVYLDGEAYFDVKSDSDKMFTVKTKDYLVNVLGTEFNVTAYSKKRIFETSLLKGSVEIVSRENQEKILLEPGNRSYFKNDRFIVSSIENYDHFLWTQGILSFDHERMEDIFEKLELYYDIKIVNDNKKINDMRYTVKFRIKDGVEHAMNVLKIPTNLNYKKDNDTNMIYIW